MVMSRRSRIGSATCVALVVSLLFAACSSTKSVKQDYSAATWILNTQVAIDLAVLGVLGVGAPTYGDYDTTDCDWGATSLNPIAVVNTYPTAQTFSITINQNLANNLNFIPYSPNQSISQMTGCSISKEYAGTQYVTVPAGSPTNSSLMVIGWIAAGGGEFNAGTGSHNVAIGAGGTQWYDFWLHNNDLNNGFENLELNYSNTGGTDPSQNVQTGLFNGLDCTSNSSGNISLTSPNSLTTPFTSNNPNAWTFNLNQPLCFGFLQPGSASMS